VDTGLTGIAGAFRIPYCFVAAWASFWRGSHNLGHGFSQAGSLRPGEFSIFSLVANGSLDPVLRLSARLLRHTYTCGFTLASVYECMHEASCRGRALASDSALRRDNLSSCHAVLKLASNLIQYTMVRLLKTENQGNLVSMQA
jgi:hypothetical protein